MSLYNDDLENYEETVFYLEFQLTGSVNAVGSVLLKKFLMDTLNLSN